MGETLRKWVASLSSRQRTIYGLLLAVIVATVPCYALGFWALTLDFFPVVASTVTPGSALATPTWMSTWTPTATATDTAVPPTATPTETPTATPTETPTEMPTETATATPTETLTMTPTGTATVTATATGTSAPTATVTASATATAVPPTATATGTATATTTATATPTTTATATLTATATVPPTATSTPAPVLLLDPASGQSGIEITISGWDFLSNTRYAIYWDPPEVLIGQVMSNNVGQIAGFTYTVPITATLGIHQVVADLEGTVIAQSPFDVIE